MSTHGLELQYLYLLRPALCLGRSSSNFRRLSQFLPPPPRRADFPQFHGI